MSAVIKVENLSKQYRLGQVGTGAMAHDINRFWHRLRGKEDPYLKIGEVNDRSVKGGSEYVWALKDINFEVEHGEVVGIIGRNGAGKSTLLKILSRTTTPTTGSVKIKGRVASLLEVGTGFHPELSGRENIFLNGAILGMTKQEIRSKFDQIVAFSGVERYIDTPVKRYSSGMYVRLAFAVAAHLEPEILIVDEVLAVGDAEFQKKALGKMKDVSNKEGRTVLFVSHNMEAIQRLCGKCILMELGRLEKVGKTEEIVLDYTLAQDELIGRPDLLMSLNEREHQGSRLATVTAIKYYSIKENKVTGPISAHDLFIHLIIDASSNIELNSIAVTIYDINGMKLVNCDTLQLDKKNEIKPGRNEVCFVLEQLPLKPGNYILGTWLAKIGSSLEIVDLVQNAITIEVLQLEIENSFGTRPSYDGPVLTNFKCVKI